MSGLTLGRAFLPQCGSLIDTEPVLLVDDDDAEARKPHALGEQRVRPDQQVETVTGAQSSQAAAATLGVRESGS